MTIPRFSRQAKIVTAVIAVALISGAVTASAQQREPMSPEEVRETYGFPDHMVYEDERVPLLNRKGETYGYQNVHDTYGPRDKAIPVYDEDGAVIGRREPDGRLVLDSGEQIGSGEPGTPTTVAGDRD